MSEHLRQDEISAFDTLADERRRAALEHFAECAACRAGWLAEDGARVFSLLARAPIPQRRLEQLSERIDTALDGLRPRRPARRRLFGAASIAASLLLAAVLGAVLWDHELPVGDVSAVAEIDALGLPAQAEEELAGIQFVDTDGKDAQVLDLSIGGTQVLMIFDDSIEL